MNWVIQGDESYTLVWVWHQHGNFLVICLSSSEEKSIDLICNLCKEPCPEQIMFQFNLFSKEEQGAYSSYFEMDQIWIETLNLEKNITIYTNDLSISNTYNAFTKKELAEVRRIIKNDYREYKPKSTKKTAKRKEHIDVLYARCVKLAETGRIGGEKERIWLDQFAKGTCLDLCCGDHIIDGAIGVDMDERKLGASFFFLNASTLESVEAGSLDSIVTNYLDVFANPLACLQAWHRTLKIGGVLALVCRNSDAYPAEGLGPLENSRRSSLYNDKILQFYLRKAKFQPFQIEKIEKSLCIASKKQ